jgi:arabinose-5-phosphate isomerase
VLIERAGISLKDFAINHPAGFLGRHLTLPEVNLMVPALDLLLIETTAHLTEVITSCPQGSPSRRSLGAT